MIWKARQKWPDVAPPEVDPMEIVDNPSHFYTFDVWRIGKDSART